MAGFRGFRGGKKKNKYNAVRCEFNGISFDSKRELKRYKYLLGLEESGVIMDLAVHPKFPFVFPDGRRVLIKGEKRNTTARYTADFSYFIITDDGVAKDGRFVVEDLKSSFTAKDGQFKLRRAIFELIYEIDLRVVIDPEEPVEV